MFLIEAIMLEKDGLESKNRRLESQLLWLKGVIYGAISDPETPPRLKERLTKALKVTGGWQPPSISDQTS